MDGNHMGQVFSASTGHSISESVLLKMQLTSPFDLAEHVCLINIQGINDFTPQTIKPKSQIEILGTEISNDAFLSKLYEEGASIVHVHLNDGIEAVSNVSCNKFQSKIKRMNVVMYEICSIFFIYCNGFSCPLSKTGVKFQNQKTPKQ